MSNLIIREETFFERVNIVKKINKKIKEKTGMSIPEMILWIVLAAIVAIIVAKYRSDVLQSQNMNNIKQGVDFISMKLKQVYPNNDYSDLTTDMAIDLGVVPKVMTVRGGKIYHPMNGELTIEKGSSGDTHVITLEGLSKAACLELQKYSPENWVNVTASCNSDDDNNTVEFEG